MSDKNKKPATAKVVETKVSPEADKKEVKSTENVIGTEKDYGIQSAKGVDVAEKSNTQDYAEDKASTKKVDEHKDFVNDVADGKIPVPASNGAELAEAVKPLVSDPQSNQPKYETASQYMAAEMAKGNLVAKD